MWENDFFANPPEFPKGEPRFLEDLKSWKIAVPHWDVNALPGADDLDMREGFTVDRTAFPDPEGLLASVYELMGDNKKAKTVKEVAMLAEKYLHAGYTVIPQNDAKNFSDDAISYYALISSVLQDVVYALNKHNIDFSFVEAITAEGLDYFKRMYFINNYQRAEWRDVTNSAHNPAKKIGFK